MSVPALVQRARTRSADPARAGRWVLDHPALTVVLVIAAVTIPYAIAGPHVLADDWVWLRDAHFRGWLHAGGPRQVGRPGAYVLYALTFGVIGEHALVLYAVQVAALAAAALAVRRCLAGFVGDTYALAVTAVWIVMPTHLSLEMWFSTVQALVAIALLASGIDLLGRVHRRGDPELRDLLPGLALMALSVAFYEVTLAVALVAGVAVALLYGHRPDAKATVVGWVLVAVPVAWSLAHESVYANAVTGRLDPTVVIPGHLSLGLAPWSAGGRFATIAGLAAALTAIVRLARAELRPSTGVAERLAAAGGAVLLIGVAPLVNFETNFFGLHDRLTAVSGIGAAMVWVGGVAMVGRAVGRRGLVAVAAAVLLVAVAVPLRVARSTDYHRAGVEAERVTAQLAADAAHDRIVERTGPIAVVDRIDGLNDGWNATAAAQLRSGDPRVVVLVGPNAETNGPPPDHPQAEF